MGRASESPNLDFLRSIAVLSVFARHTMTAVGHDLSIPLGQFGVLIFFVHTSLVLMMSLGRIELSGRPIFKSFYVQRLFRIYPLSIVCVAAIAIFHLPQVPHPDLSTLLANLFLCMNLFYKAGVSPVLWSLPYEVQMYLLLPILYLVGKAYRIRGLAIVWVVAAFAAMIQPHITGRLDIAEYVPCFLAGVISYFIGFGVVRKRVPFICWPITIALGGFIFGFATKLGFTSAGEWAMCALLGLTVPWFADMKMPLLRSAAAWIARYSYGIYLIHVYALWTGMEVMRHEPWWLRLFAILAIAFGLPVLLYHFLEHPMIQLGKRLTARKPKSETEESPILMQGEVRLEEAGH